LLQTLVFLDVEGVVPGLDHRGRIAAVVVRRQLL